MQMMSNVCRESDRHFDCCVKMIFINDTTKRGESHEKVNKSRIRTANFLIRMMILRTGLGDSAEKDFMRFSFPDLFYIMITVSECTLRVCPHKTGVGTY